MKPLHKVRYALATMVLAVSLQALAAEPLPLDRWQRHLIEEQLPWRVIFMFPADLNGDGKEDLVTGPYWYENTGAVSGKWIRHIIGEPFNNFSKAYDFDGDGDLDLLGTDGKPKSGKIIWAQNDGKGVFTVMTNIEPLDAGDFMQGVEIAKFQGDALQIALSWHKGGDGIQALTVPADPAKDTWTLSQFTDFTQNEDLGSGDIDGDGDLDLYTGTAWLCNEGDKWTVRQIGVVNDEGETTVPDRISLVDLDGDGDLDGVAGLENGKNLFWFENVAAAEDKWTRHQIGVIPGEGFSQSVADMDGDGDVDVIVGEHRGPEKNNRVIVFENLGQAKDWKMVVIDEPNGAQIDHHIGTVAADLDGDGDMDVASIGWYNPKLWVIENLAISSGAPASAPAVAKALAEGPSIAPEVAAEPGAGEGKAARQGKGKAAREGKAARQGKAAMQGKADLPATAAAGGGKKKQKAANKVKPATSLPFKHEVIDAKPLGEQNDITLLGDLNNDGKIDIVIGSKKGEAQLYWYENPTWKRRPMSTDTTLEAGGVLFDVNGDGRLDVIAGNSGNGKEMYWFENPADVESLWKKRVIENTLIKYHDQAIGDVDNDGKPELLFSSQKAGFVGYFDIPEDPTQEPWPAENRHMITDMKNMEGLVIADLDGDGKNETLVGSHIFRQQADGTWAEQVLAKDYAMARVAVGDFNKDGVKDIVLTEGDQAPQARVAVFMGPDYKQNLLRSDLFNLHSMDVADFNGDGHDDIFVGEMGLGENDEEAMLILFINKGDGTFTEALISEGVPTHEAKVADLNGDGRLDIAGKPFQPRNQIDIWLNEIEPAAKSAE